MTSSTPGVYVILVDTHSTVSAYVGSTTRTFKRRKWRHWRDLHTGKHFNSELQQAWNQYGKEAFTFMPVESDCKADSLAVREQYWLDWFRLHISVYNVALDVSMGSLAPGVRDKISKSLAGRAFTNEHKERIRQAATGRILTEETRQKISRAAVGRTASSKTKQKISAAHKNKSHSEEHKRKISEALKGRVRPAQHRRNLSRAMLARKHCGEHGSFYGGSHSEKAKARIATANSRPYPMFINTRTGETIPAGENLKSLCREKNLDYCAMNAVKNGRHRHYKGWSLA